MRTRHWSALSLLALLVIGVGVLTWWVSTRDAREPSKLAFADHCATCHGEALQGADAPALIDAPLRYGDDTPALMASIRDGFGGEAEAIRDHAFGNRLSDDTMKGLALFVAERRRHWPTTAESHVSKLPEGIVQSRHHAFSVERIASLDDRPYSLAPLPDGSFLITGKGRGLTHVDTDGVARVVPGAPAVHGIMLELGTAYLGLGWHLDLALHPNHGSNGWIYLSHTDRCQFDCGSLLPVSMVRVVRGRLLDGAWVDEEIIWSVATEHYTPVPDQVACGRLAFGHDGSLFVTVGGKAPYQHLHDLDTPYGKVHRVMDDGRIPQDNPFWRAAAQRAPASTRHTVWSYGHRTSQGLAVHPQTGEVWQTEMGPRGGDEVNRIIPGGNFGWPLYTNGLDYDGEAVAIGVDLGLDYALEDTQQPMVDFTPAPAISSFTFATGSAFDAWGDDMLVGSLKARTLYRLRIADDGAVEREALLTGIGRIRDVAVGGDGSILLLLEHGATGSLVRLVPAAGDVGAAGSAATLVL